MVKKLFSLNQDAGGLFGVFKENPGDPNDFHVPIILYSQDGITPLQMAPLVIKDYFDGTSNTTHTFSQPMHGLTISNDGSSDLTVTINGMIIPVKAGEVFSDRFDPYTQVTVNATGAFRAYGLGPSVAPVTTVDTTAPTVTASPNGGTFGAIQSVTLSANETADIYYTTDGSMPTTSSTVYSGLISITVSTTLKFFGKDSAGNSSAVQTVSFIIDTVSPTVTASPNGGSFAAAQTVTLTASETSTIYYTLDGSTPTQSSTAYSAPVTVSSTSTLKFFAKDSVGNVGAVQSVSFTITAADTTPPTITATPNGGTFTADQSVTLSADETATIYYTTDGSAPTTASTVYSAAIPISATTTLKFFGKDTAGNSSTVQTLTFTINIPDTTSPNPVTNLVAGTPTSNSIPVTWTDSTSGDVANYEAAYSTDGTNFTVSSAAVNSSSTSYTVTGLTVSTSYTVRVVAIDNAGNRSTAATVTATTTAAPITHLSLNGTSDYIKTPSITFDEIVIDFVAYQTSGVDQMYVDARAGHSAGYFHRTTNNNDSYGIGTGGFTSASVNGVAKSNATAFVPNGTRCTVDLIMGSSAADDVNFFCDNVAGAGTFMKADVYDIKLKNAGTVVAHYDMSTGTVNDQSGNGYNATLHGGTWA